MQPIQLPKIMKHFMFEVAQRIRRIHVFGWAVTWLLFISISPCLYGAEASTNWNWLSLSLSIGQTNSAVGEKIPVTMIVSNCADIDHIVYCNEGDPCVCGPGKISIVEVASGKTIECKLSTLQRAGLQNNYFTKIQGHNSKEFNLDLISGYEITNAGFYQVQGLGWFPTTEPSTNHEFTAVSTPPVIILLTPKIK